MSSSDELHLEFIVVAKIPSLLPLPVGGLHGTRGSIEKHHETNCDRGDDFSREERETTATIHLGSLHLGFRPGAVIGRSRGYGQAIQRTVRTLCEGSMKPTGRHFQSASD